MTWKNWSGSVRCTPAAFVRPTTIEAVSELVRQSARDGHVVRVAGAGHSFTPLAQTDGILVSLDGLKGIESLDAQRREATVFAGTRLYDLGLNCPAGPDRTGAGDVEDTGSVFFEHPFAARVEYLLRHTCSPLTK